MMWHQVTLLMQRLLAVSQGQLGLDWTFFLNKQPDEVGAEANCRMLTFDLSIHLTHTGFIAPFYTLQRIFFLLLSSVRFNQRMNSCQLMALHAVLFLQAE